jgi:hypothetical protein
MLFVLADLFLEQAYSDVIITEFTHKTPTDSTT